ncbi:39S ribosomal protein L47, mitochondrial [Lagopus muta]|uniref:39S ribosomal protein L47, mitochondrial n=1 Tax=Lagopus muta TaxID=64668 RepID=UPI00209CEA13|nr:39S ribosomal protein L47, mitochondrial [Lagopus muta]
MTRLKLGGRHLSRGQSVTSTSGALARRHPRRRGKMAAATAMAALGRRLAVALRLTGARPGPAAAGLLGFTQNRCHESLAQAEPLCHARLLHTTLPRKGLEEFFDDPKNWGEKTVKSGDAWNIKQLRAKSSQDLHKLWYVLLKEKNMLLTLEQESKRQQKPMPSPERLEKVQKSMKNIDLVVKEREIALRLLQTGHEKPVPGEWRNDFLGRTYWYSYKEWPIPWYLNKKYKKRKFYYLPHVNRFIRLRLEKYLRQRNRRQNLEKKKQKLLEKKFPHLAVKSQSQ